MGYELHEQVSSREALAKPVEEERTTNKREIVQLQHEARQHQMAPTNTILPMDRGSTPKKASRRGCTLGQTKNTNRVGNLNLCRMSCIHSSASSSGRSWICG